MQNNNNPEIISAKEAARLLGISLNSVYTLLNSDPTFPAILCSGKWIIRKDRIFDWFDSRLNHKIQNK